MYCFGKLWKITKKQPDILVFYGFLFTFTFTIRKVILFYPIREKFNEYTGLYLYLSDIFLFLTLFFWTLSILYNKNIEMSIKDALRGANLAYFYNTAKKLFLKWHLSIPLLLIIWSFLSTTWAQNQFIALFRSVKLLELYLLYTYIVHKISTSWDKDGKNSFLQDICKIIIIIGIFQSVIAIGQFIVQHSLGFFWLKESLISSNIAGVAKIIFDGKKVIRAYGLFPHPNILGGFLLFSIILTYYYRKLFHVEQFGTQDIKNCSTWNIISKLQSIIVSRLPAKWVGKTIWNMILPLQFIALLLTFSKSAIIGLIIAFLYINTWNTKFKYIHNVPRGTIFKVIVLSGLTTLLLSLALTKIDTNSFFLKSLNERIEYLNVPRGTILDNPIIGLGSGQFVISMQKYASTQLQIWQFQPVHNVFLFIWSELGLIGLGLFIVFSYKLFHVEQLYSKTHTPWKVDGVERIEKNSTSLNYAVALKVNCSTWNNLEHKTSKIVPRGTILSRQRRELIYNTLFKPIMLGYLFIMLFDHYLWDIQQGQAILWITLGLVAATQQKMENDTDL